MSGGRISGWFEVDVPKVVLGYDFVERPSDAKQNVDDDDENRMQRGSMFKTMVEVLITLQPPIAVPPGVFRVTQSASHARAPHRIRVARRRAEKWYRRLAAMKRTYTRLRIRSLVFTFRKRIRHFTLNLKRYTRTHDRSACSKPSRQTYVNHAIHPSAEASTHAETRRIFRSL